MVSKINQAKLGGLALAGLALFFIIRGAGQKLDAFAENFKFPEFPQFPSIPNISIGLGDTKIESTFPKADNESLEILKKINENQGLAGFTQNEILKLLSGLDPLGSKTNPASDPTAPTPTDVILNDKSLTQEQKDALLGIINPQDPNDPNNNPDLFQPKDGRGFTGREEDRALFEAGLIDANGRPIITNQNDSPLVSTNPNQVNVQTPDSFRTFTDGDKIITSIANEQNLGGGVSFQGGITTLGDNTVDTLSEVLSIFPGLTASQARDALMENPNLSPGEFALINPDVRNISNVDDVAPQIFNNTSNSQFNGLTPEQIFKLITGGQLA